MVTIMVTNVDEMGMVTLSAMQPTVGMEIMATLTDLDMVVDMPTVMWQWASSSDMSAWADIEDDHVGQLHPGGWGRGLCTSVPRRCTRTDTAQQERIGGVGEHGGRRRRR